jgi:hypothetical protein
VRVALVILDGFPRRHVGRETTPVLCSLTARGCGRAVMTSATYPNHATFATGCTPAEHGLLANWVVTSAGAQPAERVGVRVPTLFDATTAAGVDSVAVVGDQKLVPVMGAAAATDHWPPAGVIPAGTPVDAHGYAMNADVVAAATAALAGSTAGLVVVHLNEPDTAGHVHGPDSADARAVYRSTDAALGEVLELLRPAWSDTVVIVVSDHDMTTVDAAHPIDLWSEVGAHGLDHLLPIPEGDATIVWGEDPTNGVWLTTVDGIAGHEPVGMDARLVWAEPGRRFALPPGLDGPGEPGTHGGVATRQQVAAAGGGHPAATALAAVVAASTDTAPIDATAWAPTIAGLLDVALPAASGVSLV